MSAVSATEAERSPKVHARVKLWLPLVCISWWPLTVKSGVVIKLVSIDSE